MDKDSSKVEPLDAFIWISLGLAVFSVLSHYIGYKKQLMFEAAIQYWFFIPYFASLVGILFGVLEKFKNQKRSLKLSIFGNCAIGLNVILLGTAFIRLYNWLFLPIAAYLSG